MILNPSNVLTVCIPQLLTNPNTLLTNYSRVIFNDQVHYRFAIKPRELDLSYKIIGFDLTNQLLECNQFSQVVIYNNNELINTFETTTNQINIYSISNIDNAVIDIYVKTNKITSTAALEFFKATNNKYNNMFDWPWRNVVSVYRNNASNDVFDVYNCFLSYSDYVPLFENSNIILLADKYNLLLSNTSMPIQNKVITSQNVSNTIINISGSDLVCNDNVIIEYIPPLNIQYIVS